MIESIFLIEWDSIKEGIESNNKTNSNNNHNNNNHNNNNNHKNNNYLDENNKKGNINGSLVENTKVLGWYPQNNVILNNSITFNRIINAHFTEIRDFYQNSRNKNKIKNQSSKNSKNTSIKGKKAKSIDKIKNSGENSEKDEVETTAEQIFFEKITGVSSGLDLNVDPGEFFNEEISVSPSQDLNKKKFKIGIQTHNIFDYDIISCYISPNRIICLIFEKKDNLQNFILKFEGSIDTFILLNKKEFDNLGIKEEDFYELETILASIFMDIRSHNLLLMEEESFYIETSDVDEETVQKERDKIIKVFIYGIDNAGKSSLMRYLKTGKYDHNYFAPTKKFVVHKIPLQKEKIKLICWEMPGQKSFRRVWLRGVQASNLVVYMLDAADKERYAEAKRAFWSIMTRYEVKKVPVLFIANKIDIVDNGHELAEIESYFSLPELKEREWTTKFMSLVTQEGIKETIDWITDIINENH
ncbi:MAG: GTP-binding protein [archaeon]|nr:GTP-binding protein [archaeon]